ncbi:MAG: tRNA (adenosine(37)-N6)-threonylcarbamoyltransferase complex dimerization subunit type 1 TsaB [Pseudomonadales bacterium]|nr:tRNA (adenosine(37)-N6)-threonylcarbamoyltransferase complex dimerization subunit type 1 TsaB [Pseudomonadales bacterium]
MNTILAIEASSVACSVALLSETGVRAMHARTPRAHNRLLLPYADALLEAAGLTPADVDAVAFGHGPGSFTGLRLAAAFAQGLAWAHDRPVLGVSSLHVLARTVLEDERRDGRALPDHVLVLVDARMDELYANLYRVDEGGEPVPLGRDALCAPEKIAELVPQLGSCMVVGDGLLHEARIPWPEGLRRTLRPDALPHARWLLHLAAPRLRNGEGGAASLAAPVYLRDETRWRRLGDPVVS